MLRESVVTLFRSEPLHMYRYNPSSIVVNKIALKGPPGQACLARPFQTEPKYGAERRATLQLGKARRCCVP
jgi:hypothetical protein